MHKLLQVKITNQVQNLFVFKSRTPNSLVTDPSISCVVTGLCQYRYTGNYKDI